MDILDYHSQIHLANLFFKQILLNLAALNLHLFFIGYLFILKIYLNLLNFLVSQWFFIQHRRPVIIKWSEQSSLFDYKTPVKLENNKLAKAKENNTLNKIIILLMSDPDEIKNKRKHHKHERNRELDFSCWTDE